MPIDFTQPEEGSPFDAFADGYPTLWLCIPESMKENVGVSEVTASGGVWSKISRNKEGPESGSSTSELYVYRKPKGRLHLRVQDPVSGEMRWAEHSTNGKPLRLQVDSNPFGLSAYRFFDPSLEGTSFGLNSVIPASTTHTNPMPQGITYAGFSLYLVSNDPNFVASVPEESQIQPSGVIRPGIWRTEGKFGLDTSCQWIRLRDPSSADPVIQVGSDPGPQGVTVESTDWGFMILGYQEWTLETQVWLDGTYVIGQDIQPGTYATPGPNQDRASTASWQVLDSSLNVIRSGEVGQDGGGTTVTLKYTDYAFITENFSPWKFVAPTEKAEEGTKPPEWRHLLNMEHRNASTVQYDNLVVEESGRRAGLGYLVGASLGPAYYLAADPSVTGYFTVDFGYALAFLQTFASGYIDKMQAAVARFNAWAWSGDGYAELLDVGEKFSFNASFYGYYNPVTVPEISPAFGPLAGMDINVVRPYGEANGDALKYPAGKVIAGIDIDELEVRHGTEFFGASSASGQTVYLNHYPLWSIEYPKEYLLEGRVKTFALTMRESSGVSSLFLTVNAGLLY